MSKPSSNQPPFANNDREPNTLSALTPDREQFEQQLRHWLELPSRHLAMRPDFAPELSYGRHRGPATPGVRPAAVIALFYPHADQWYLPLTLRTQHLNDHAGQVSFPGGAREPGETSQQCALRELREELGVVSEGIHIIGRLSPAFVYVSNFLVQPFVAVSSHRPAFRPDPLEVEQVLEVSVKHLLDATNYSSLTLPHRAITYLAPCITFRGHNIWGATSVMLSELIGILREIMGDYHLSCTFRT
jgi:8-oxo-dGTP pyrophosphatase MutT (NUDIX family)